MGARAYRVSRIVLVNLMYLVVGLSFALSGLLSPAGFLWFALFTAAVASQQRVHTPRSSPWSRPGSKRHAGTRHVALPQFRLLPAALGLLGTGFLAENVGLTTTFVVTGTIIVAVGAAGFFHPPPSCGSTATPDPPARHLQKMRRARNNIHSRLASKSE